MTMQQFQASLAEPAPAPGLSAPLRALWWDARGDWTKAHVQVDDGDTPQAMAVHAYLHRREGDLANASTGIAAPELHLTATPLKPNMLPVQSLLPVA